MDDTERKFKEKCTVSRMFTVPKLFWDEWKADCKENFNDTYHLKMQLDHEFRKQFSTVSALLMQDLVELKERVTELEERLLTETSQYTDEGKKSSESSSDRVQSTRKTFG